MLSNTQVAQKLLEIRTLMEMAGDSFYKYMAYEKAAASVENAPPLGDLVATRQHLKLPGVGKSIGAVIEAVMILVGLEGGKYVIPPPFIIASQPGPRIVITSLAPHVDHAIDRGRPTETLPTRIPE